MTQLAAPSRNKQKWIRLRIQKRLGVMATIIIAVLGPLLAIATFLVLGPLGQSSNSPALRIVLLADLIYSLALAALVAQRVIALLVARRSRSAGSKLHLRLMRLFAALALLPTVIVAVFAIITVNFGLEGWFSERVQNVLSTSLSAAQAYEDEHRVDLRADSFALARFLNSAKQSAVLMDDGDVRQLLVQGQSQIQRGLKEAFVIDGSGEIRSRGERSYLFDFERPKDDQLEISKSEGHLIIEDWDNNEFRLLMPLTSFVDRYLYVSREVDGQILSLLDDTRQTVKLYEQLESDRGQLLFEFGLIYFGFAVVMILAATWSGIWFAEQLARPVGRLAMAVQRVGEGELETRVPEENRDDEIGMLSRYFNQMTADLKEQRDRLIETSDQIERRRRLFDSVLSSVTSGVVGLDAEGNVDFANRSAQKLLDIQHDNDHRNISQTVPEFYPMLEELQASKREVTQNEVRIIRNGKLEILLVRMSQRYNEHAGLEGFVLAFDDVTDLVSAQRMAAWGDVARRIAHEIKNPLTPIQLSAERIRRKFSKSLAEEEKQQLGDLTEVIVRQTNDLRRIVDEFSKFARMPEPAKKSTSLKSLINSAVTLQMAGNEAINYEVGLPENDVNLMVDPTMMSQVLTNLLKNASESIEKKYESSHGMAGSIRVSLREIDENAVIEISDNGIGLPEDRTKLFEPYYTTRAEGTGLGLSIVKKIVEDHNGNLVLESAEAFEDCEHQGARAIITLPLDDVEESDGSN